jgi:hypothetical protein
LTVREEQVEMDCEVQVTGQLRAMIETHNFEAHQDPDIVTAFALIVIANELVQIRKKLVGGKAELTTTGNI